MLAHIADLHGSDTAIGISVITIAELAHGVARANTPELRQKRDGFLQELLTAVSIYPITPQIALRAGHINGERQANGVSIPFRDLLIGVTALQLNLNYVVATANVSDFEMIPNLIVVELF
jgi:predicted nucleic acid-binding protein